MQLANYLGYLHATERDLAGGFHEVGQCHAADAEVRHVCRLLAEQCATHAEKLKPFADRYGEDAPPEPDRLRHELFGGCREGGLGLLRDLHDLYLLAQACDIAWTVVGQAARGADDLELLDVVGSCEAQTALQLKWLKTTIKQAAPQALLVSS